MKYKKLKIMLLLLLIISFVYAQSDVQDQINDFFFLEGVTFNIGNTTVNNIQEKDNKMILNLTKTTLVFEHNVDEIYVDIFPENCSKLGFVYMPGQGYDYVKETIQFTGYEGWALGIAYSRNDNFDFALEDMTVFIDKATKQKLTPIVRILGNNWQQEVMPVDNVVKFIKNLSQATNNKLEYIQIWDKPNIIFEDNDVFEKPKDYANYVININNSLNNSDIKIISGSLSLGKSGKVGENDRKDANSYISGLLNINEFWDVIDYWGSSVYEADFSGEDYCLIAENIDFYKGQELCLDSVYGYRWELEKIKKSTGKTFKTVLTEVGYPTTQENVGKTKELLYIVKSDPYVESGLIFIANGWDIWHNSAWFNKENKTLSNYAYLISETVCE